MRGIDDYIDGIPAQIIRKLIRAAEPAEPGHHAGAVGGLCSGLDALDQGVAGIDIDAGILVTEGSFPGFVCHGLSAGFGVWVRGRSF